MSNGKQLRELYLKTAELASESEAIEAKSNEWGRKQKLVLAAVLGSVAASVTLMIIGEAPGNGMLFGVGAAFLLVPFVVFGKVMSGGMSRSIAYNFVNAEGNRTAMSYQRLLEDTAEAAGIDPGSIKTRERAGEFLTSFTATKNNLPVQLTVKDTGKEMVIMVNGEPLREPQMT